MLYKVLSLGRIVLYIVVMALPLLETLVKTMAKNLVKTLAKNLHAEQLSAFVKVQVQEGTAY